MSVALALLIAVLLHVTWNLMSRRYQPSQDFLWWGLAGQALLGAPFVVWLLFYHGVSSELWGLIAITGAAEIGYFLSLSSAYQRTSASVVYPLARSSPLLIALAATLWFNTELSLVGWAGILLTVAGLVLLALSAWQGEMRRGLLFALSAACFTSIYSLSDKAATDYLHSFAAIYAYATIACSCAWLGITVRQRYQHKRWIPPRSPHIGVLGIASLSIGGAYALVIHAMREIEASVAVAFSNGGIVLAVLAGIVIFKEKGNTRLRILGAFTIVTGLALLAAR